MAPKRECSSKEHAGSKMPRSPSSSSPRGRGSGRRGRSSSSSGSPVPRVVGSRVHLDYEPDLPAWAQVEIPGNIRFLCRKRIGPSETIMLHVPGNVVTDWVDSLVPLEIAPLDWRKTEGMFHVYIHSTNSFGTMLPLSKRQSSVIMTGWRAVAEESNFSPGQYIDMWGYHHNDTPYMYIFNAPAPTEKEQGDASGSGSGSCTGGGGSGSGTGGGGGGDINDDAGSHFAGAWRGRKRWHLSQCQQAQIVKLHLR